MNPIKEVYNYREMIKSLVRKNLRGRYKGSVLGFLWTFVNPLLQLVVYTLVFSIIMRSEHEQYYLFLFVALIPWIFFSTSLTDGSRCVLDEKDMIKKIYFPRAVLPISTVTSAFINMLLSFVVVIAVTLFSGRGIDPVALLGLPIVMAVEYILCLGFAMIVSGVTVYLRDMQYILGIITMAWQYVTPLMYDVSLVPERLRFIFYANPMTPIIEIYRDILYYKQFPDMTNLIYALIVGVASFIIGWAVFNKLQKGFAETF